MQHDETCKTKIERSTAKRLAPHDRVVMLLLILGAYCVLFPDGQTTHFENIVKVVTLDLVCIVENERAKAKVGGRQDLSTIALRVTTIFRLGDCASCHWLISSGSSVLSHSNL